ncbi:MAG: folate family ECF transporter S component [Spirochaetaceae bacterium]|jgi:ECF transporter S component (folate family)|nr:folate family ECF transporter S component [Spirochaetaceae bacterium]
MPKVKQLVLAGLLLAVAIVFRQFLRIPITPTLRLTLSFVPYILAGWLLGPVWAGVVGVVGDILGMVLFPTGAFFPGYTFNELLTCLIYGFFLFNRPVDRRLFVRLVISLVLVHLVVQLGLNTLWLSVQAKQAFIVLLPPRVIANIARFPIELAAMFFLLRLIEKPVDRYLRTKPVARDDDDGTGSQETGQDNES